MKAAPYNPDTLTRIRNGATPSELGWDSTFYLTVCRKHEIPPNIQAPKAAPIVAPSLAPRPLSAYTASTPKPHAVAHHFTGAVYYDADNHALHRDGTALNLRGRNVDVFDALAKLPDGVTIKGPALADAIGIAHGSMACYVTNLRDALGAIGLGVKGIKGGNWHGGGYFICDLRTQRRIAVERRVPAKSSGAAP